MKDNTEELLPIVNREGKVIGKATRGECHRMSFLLHPVVHLHVFNDSGELFLQQRPEWKDVQPGKWDTAVGGHVDYGEEIAAAVLREAEEEIGLRNINPTFLTAYNFESKVEAEQVNIFIVHGINEVIPSKETDGGKFWAINDIVKTIGKDVFTPNFEQEFQTYILPYISCFYLQNLPPISSNLKVEDGSLKIFDSIRKKYVVLTPEESVRQRFTGWLINDLGYPQALINNEIQIKLNDTKRRCDTVVFGKDLKPLMIVEYKAPSINISQAVFDQIVRYNMVLQAKCLVVSNGMNHYCCVIDYDKNSYRFVEQIPDYTTLKEL